MGPNGWPKDDNLIVFRSGDGSVPTSATMSPAFKWAWEHDQKMPHAKPVTFNELCGVYNTRSSPFEGQDEDESNKEVTKTEYGGIPCNCRASEPTKGAKCDHQNQV